MWKMLGEILRLLLIGGARDNRDHPDPARNSVGAGPVRWRYPERERKRQWRLLWAVIILLGGVCGLAAALAILARMY